MHGPSLTKRKKKRKLRVLLCLLILLFYFFNLGILIPSLIFIIFELRNEIIQFFRKICGKTLFEGNDKLFRKHINGIKNYGEYGVGESTICVFKNTNANIISVDTSKEWIDIVKSKINQSKRTNIDWIDLGKIGDWGTPISYKKRHHIQKYLESIWIKENKPDLILIDGRFRVACFLYSLLQAKPGVKIIFDDYKNRFHYHIIEEFIKPDELYKKQAFFIVPTELDQEKIKKTMFDFLHVMD